MNTRLSKASLFFSVVCVSFLSVAPALSEFDETFTVGADTLVLRNLIGEIRIEGGSGSFEVEVAARGADATKDNVAVELHDTGSRAEMGIEFPLDREKRYVYPRMDGRSKTRFDSDEGGSGFSRFLSGLFGGRGSDITVSGSGSGMELWADVTVRMPDGAHLEIGHGVGKIFADGVEGTLTLDIRSGGVEVRSVEGDLSVDTGAGSVLAEEIRGSLVVDTGSGSVKLSGVEVDKLDVDTGSGGIRIDRADAQWVNLDTGSGRVTATALGADEARIDTGSGSIEVAFARLGTGKFEIDTGSGSVRLDLPADASATVEAESGNGGISVDFDGADVRRMERDEALLVIGGGAARFKIDTGNGGITIGRAD